MLKILRNKKVTRLVLWGTLILILPAFVIWGAGSISHSKDKGPTYAGIIDDKKISFDAFSESLSAVRCQIYMNYFSQPQVIDVLMKNKAFIGKLAWDMLIMSREAKKRKLKATDAEVINFIRNHPLFSRGGKFDDRIYEYILKNNLSIYPRNFEEMARNALAIQKLNNILTKDVKVTDEEVLERYKLDNEKFKISYNFIDLANGTAETTTPLFSKTDYIEGVGEALPLAEVAIHMNKDDISAPIKVRKGTLTFKLLEIQPIDEEKFKKDKDEYTKKALEAKKNTYLEGWLRKLELNTKILIDFKDYDKYFR